MNPVLRISTIALLATTLAMPAPVAFAETSIGVSRAVASIQKLPAGQLIDRLGLGSASTFSRQIERAKAINLISITDIYGGQGFGEITTKLTSSGRTNFAVKRMQADLAADGAAKAWFAEHKVDIANVVALEQKGMSVNVYIY